MHAGGSTSGGRPNSDSGLSGTQQSIPPLVVQKQLQETRKKLQAQMIPLCRRLVVDLDASRRAMRHAVHALAQGYRYHGNTMPNVDRSRATGTEVGTGAHHGHARGG